MKRFGVIFILFVFVGTLFAPRAHASQPTNNFESFMKIVDEKSKENTIAKEWYGTDSVGVLQGAGIGYTIGGSTDPESTFYYGKSAVAYLDRTITAMYQTPPANLALWIQDTGQTLGFIPKQAYAQGIGFTGLSPLLDIWKAFRNIAYGLLAVVMIAIGFMVMFRQKIDPKTVITVQSALPRIVIALLLITFSYAIVGLMIDLMYVLLTLIISVLVSSSHGTLGADTATKYLAGGFGTILGAVFKGSVNSLNDLVAFFSPGGTIATTAVTGGLGVGALSWILAGTAAGATASPGIAFLGLGLPILLLFIVAIILLFAVIRLTFLLVGAYIQIIISVLTAPFQLLATAIPGNNTFGSWLLNLTANLLVFPITAGLLLVANILANLEAHPVGTFGATGPAFWTPPLLGGTGHGVAGVIALGMLLSIPSIVNSIKESFKAKPPVPTGGFAGIAGLFGTTTQYGVQYALGKIQMDAMQKALKGMPPVGKTNELIAKDAGGGGQK